MARNKSFDTTHNTPKESIRKKIRHALSDKTPYKYANIDIYKKLFNDDNPIGFVEKFRQAGGKFLPFEEEQELLNYLADYIKRQGYSNIFCVNPYLRKKLEERQIITVNYLMTGTPAELAVVFASGLLARNGGLLFTQHDTLYPSVKNLAAEVIVIGGSRAIFLDLTSALSSNTPSHQSVPLCEIIIPTLPNNEQSNPQNPRFMLYFLLS